MSTTKENPEHGFQGYLDKIDQLSLKNKDWTREQIIEVRDFLSPWNHNIKLRHGVFTTDCEKYYPAHHEIMKIVNHELRGEFRDKRILDVGCLESYFTTECALQGANALGVDGKLINIKKCEFVKSVLDIPNLEFVQDDAMQLTQSKYGSFDAVLALGLLYHLDNPYGFLKNVAELCTGFMVLDTHVALEKQPESIKGTWKPELSELQEFQFGGQSYTGRLFREFDAKTSRAAKDLSVTASLENDFSLWLTEDSLIRMLGDVGFEEVSKKVASKQDSKRDRSWWSDIEQNSRVLMLAVKRRTPFQSKVFVDT